MKSWIATLPHEIDANLIKHIENQFDGFITSCFAFITKKCKLIVPVSEIHVAHNLMKIYKISLCNETFLEQCVNPRVKQDELIHKLDMNFLFALMWSVGVIMSESGQKLFSQFLRKMCQDIISCPHRKEKGRPFRFEKSSHFPESRMNIHEYFLENYKWRSWKDKLEKLEREGGAKVDSNLKYHEIVVPTTDTLKFTYIIEVMLMNEISPLLVGPTGTGKTVYINSYLKRLSKEKFTPIFICFSAQTSANQTQDIIDSKLDRRRKKTYGPAFGKKCFIFIDDLNMPALEKYGAQPPIELLRQFMDHKVIKK
jgi:dynein heavy chain, axonemal